MLPKPMGPGQGVVYGARVGGANLSGHRGLDPGHHDRRASGPKARNDLEDLGCRFPLAEDHFRKTPPQVAVVIHLGEAQILEGEELKLAERLFDAHGSPLDGMKEGPRPLLVHVFPENEIIPCRPARPFRLALTSSTRISYTPDLPSGPFFLD